MSGGFTSVVLTGASGTVGSFLAPFLAAEGYEVFAISRRPIDFPYGRLVLVDLSDPDAVLPKFVGAVTVHCAALTTDGWNRKVELLNDLLTERALQLADEGFIHLSSSSVYDLSGDSIDTRPEAATGNYRFYNSYSRSKFSSEQIVRRAQKPGVMLRAHGIYGPNDNTLLPRVRRSIRAGMLPLPGGGNRLHSFTSLDTLTGAVLAAIRSLASGGLTKPAAVNVTDSEPRILREAIQLALGEPVQVRNVPTGLALMTGRLLELRRKTEPAFSSYVIRQLAYQRTYNLDSATELIGYQPLAPKFDDYFGNSAAAK